MRRLKILKIYFVLWLFLFFLVYSNFDAASTFFMATVAFNEAISSIAAQAGLAMVDANSLMNQLANGGITTGEFTLTSNLVTGGAFSLDGVHPTARGYALIANEFMKAIDATYGSNFEASGNLVNVGDYPTNYSPTLQ